VVEQLSWQATLAPLADLVSYPGGTARNAA
jgi:hypothetical protein